MTRMRILFFALLALPGVAFGERPCREEADDRLRLACYDREAKSDPNERAALVPQASPIASSTASDREGASSPLSREWELADGDRRGVFVLRTYLPNLLLPLHLTSSINRAPASPTHPGSGYQSDYHRNEAKIQISLRTKVAEDLFLPGAALWMAYSQQSLMQVWDSADSSPFRSSDYQPEAIYVVPVAPEPGRLPLGWSLRLVELGLAHQSNGQSDPLSRSWNRVYLGAGLEQGASSFHVRVNQRIKARGVDDNPDLVDYIGRVQMRMAWKGQASTFGATWRTNLTGIRRGSIKLDWSRPVLADKPAGLQWYAQLFSGYGETLLDYNHPQTSLGLGLALFQF